MVLDRRMFLATGAGAAWLSPGGAMAAETGIGKRVGLIGCGWYGKCDLLRLLQVGTQRRSTPHLVEAKRLSSVSCILANVSNDLHRMLAWDHAAHRVTGDDVANRLLARSYRDPWRHPAG